MKNPVASLVLILCVAVALASATPCRSNARLVHTTTKPGPYGSEQQLSRALAVARLVATIHDHFEIAGVCYFAMGRTLEGVWRHASSLPHASSSADLAVLDTHFDAARHVLLTELEMTDNYIIETKEGVDHIKISILLEGKPSAHVNIFVYSMSDDLTHLFHPEMTYKPASETVFPTKLASFHDGSIRVPADVEAYLSGQLGSELDSPKAFSWTHMDYVTPHEAMSTEFPLVSVIVPTYERPKFLAKAIELIRRQDYPNLEIVVVDDGRVSQMDNPDMKGVLSASDVRYLYLTERCSIGTKRNIAVGQARGEIVVHWDDDDYFREHRISEQVAPIIRGEVDMTVLEHHYYFILSTNTFYIVRRASSWGPHFGTFVYRKSIFDSGIRYPDNSVAEDYAFAELALNKGATIYVMNNEDGKHIYVRHHNTWEFDLKDFDVQIKEVPRPSFMSEQDWQYYSTLESTPMSAKPVNHYSSSLIQWDRPELKPQWFDDVPTYELTIMGYPRYPSYSNPRYPSYASTGMLKAFPPTRSIPLPYALGIGTGVAVGLAAIFTAAGASYYFYNKQKRYVNYAPINQDSWP